MREERSECKRDASVSAATWREPMQHGEARQGWYGVWVCGLERAVRADGKPGGRAVYVCAFGDPTRARKLYCRMPYRCCCCGAVVRQCSCWSERASVKRKTFGAISLSVLGDCLVMDAGGRYLPSP